MYDADDLEPPGSGRATRRLAIVLTATTIVMLIACCVGMRSFAFLLNDLLEDAGIRPR